MMFSLCNLIDLDVDKPHLNASHSICASALFSLNLYLRCVVDKIETEILLYSRCQIRVS